MSDNYERRKTYREHHDKMGQIEQELAVILAQTRLGICHTPGQIKSGAKTITHMIERTERAINQEERANGQSKRHVVNPPQSGN